jgi:hypothetical protein
MKVLVIRGINQKPPSGETFVQSRVFIDGVAFSFCVEDQDRHLETEGISAKVPKLTAIPRGVYPLSVTMSARFKKRLPFLDGVPGFSGVRIHGGNKAENSEGCLIFGATPTPTGVANCAGIIQLLIDRIDAAHAKNELCTIEVK